MGMIDFFGNMFNPVLDPIFRPLLSLHPAFSLSVITLIITLIMVLVYKKFTDQEVMKSVREEMKEIQKEMKEFQHDAAKVMELQKKSLEKAGQQFKQSMKPMFITMIPIIVLFGWLSSNLAFNPLTPGEEFSTTIVFKEGVNGEVKLIASDGIEILSDEIQTIEGNEVGGWFKKKIGEASWNIKGSEGEHQLTYEYEDEIYFNELLITNSKKYKEPKKLVNDEVVETIELGNEPIKIFGLSWFWAYFILAMVFNGLLRKLFKVH
ncbi:MAG: EMC3/TMCO1 family protein [Candidatus Woesearchaeota archaeon]|jgi:uncharacterized membrane protein (DUF106 family)|nr:EMC3/TMCO1 family protein [Candidatus Woesearchaeota archaeon]